ncbi:aromatase [Thermosporothrix hazakensis]|jgi:aromatase|uniref:Aromatase n=1 Tax=Thermosporothrix hazakensis TaxID=644383 RepID=A0A326U725_THEHA|nr:SRPBCC family protein [Thermosporothrix hazakensis]PZW29258.1 aromatase [Thermosporothrix hazakensis]GCE45390.1 hypothetical protein KTH_02590 [Thermosporothrix hazakensis]
MGYLRNAIVIAAPLDDVFRLTSNVRTWPTLFCEYESCTVLDEGPDTVTFRLTTHPDEQGKQCSREMVRHISQERRLTVAELLSSDEPLARLVIRWWYDPIEEHSTVMTWEQEFSLQECAPISDEKAVNYFSEQARQQQAVMKERVERLWTSAVQERLF